LGCFGDGRAGGRGSGLLMLPVLCPVVAGMSVGVPGVAVGVPVGVAGALVGVPGSGRPRTGCVLAGSFSGVGSGQLEEEIELPPGEGVRAVTSLRPEGDGVLLPILAAARRSCSEARRTRISSDPRLWRSESRPGLGVRAGLAPKGRLWTVVLCVPRAGS
jgi:hypothetical protein